MYVCMSWPCILVSLSQGILNTEPSAAPTALVVVNVTSTSFALAWSDPPIDAHNGVIRHFDVILTDERTNLTSRTTVQGREILFQNLLPFTNYTYQISAFTVGNGPLSTAETIESLEDGQLNIYIIIIGINTDS